jgi:hypothetical protein
MEHGHVTLTLMCFSTFAARISYGGAFFLLVVFSGLGSAAELDSLSTSQPMTHPSAQESERVAKRFITEKLQFWQGRLSLSDWKISIDLVRREKLEPDTLGNVHWDTDNRQASIGVLSTRDYPMMPFRDMLEDMELTVVHELVHIHLASLPRSEASRGREERAVDQLSRALLKLAKSR